MKATKSTDAHGDALGTPVVDPAALLECLDLADQLRTAAEGEARVLEDRVLFG